MSIPKFPKIPQIGTKYVLDIFDGAVEITEKVDGSNFAFGRIDDNLEMRSRNKPLFADSPEKMFNKAIETATNLFPILPSNVIFYCEYLKTQKQNVLSYANFPKNHLVLFAVVGADGEFVNKWTDLKVYADVLGIDVAPLLYWGVGSPEHCLKLIQQKSFLGTMDIEGLVVKNYSKGYMMQDQEVPVMTAKLVSEDFKEVHDSTWKKDHTSQGSLDSLMESYRTEARWLKAVQHIRENGELTDTTKDIGPLIKAIQADIKEEDKDLIKEQLWKIFGPGLIRKATAGFPEWYKNTMIQDYMNS